jgi:hypothetical protein
MKVPPELGEKSEEGGVPAHDCSYGLATIQAFELLDLLWRSRPDSYSGRCGRNTISVGQLVAGKRSANSTVCATSSGWIMLS